MLGDKFCSGRYIIAHKLGFDRSATTWLAEDTEQGGRLVALRISTAESTDRMHELEILLRLTKAELKFPGKANTQCLLDSFTSEYERGERVSWPSTSSSPARVIAAQLVLGVQFIHSQGTVHGDLYPGNILLQLPPDMVNMNFQQLRAKIPEPEKELIVREDGAPFDPGVPPELVIPIWLGIDSDQMTLEDASIKIADFGEVFDPREDNQYKSHTPLLLAPSESRFANAGSLDEPISSPELQRMEDATEKCSKRMTEERRETWETKKK
ncbi:uncharacterized protein BDV17DRAFT_286375 [Aspergillus undulatus]|uniref:uncharacterized protein n=1 Tax=Aspergillus undulatus TaxID=1810928 RepID=UPI003CCE0533